MSSSDIPSNHPRALSLALRKRIEDHVETGLVAKAGPIAHGRGEAFDYLIGEQTLPCVLNDIETAAALLLKAKHPVISVNGNAAVLVPTELVALAAAIPAKLEVNVFYGRTFEREKMLAAHLMQHGAKEVLGIHTEAKVPNLHSARQHVDINGIAQADVVLVPLEDGDRTKALIDWGKKVISIDLNPFSRTARDSTINICDNIVRCVPELTKAIQLLKADSAKAEKLIAGYDKTQSTKNIIQAIQVRLNFFQ
ncbi:phosphopantothenate/pantothenate synthetase [bacterium]|nr:phosphopantothenate/pantothenate synthetase [bacterium]